MKLGRTYRLADVRRGDLEHLAADLKLDPAETIQRAVELTEAIAERHDEVHGEGATSARFAEALDRRVSATLRLFR